MGSLVRWTPSFLGAVARDSALAGESEYRTGLGSTVFNVLGEWMIPRNYENAHEFESSVRPNLLYLLQSKMKSTGTNIRSRVEGDKIFRVCPKKKGEKSHNYRKKRTQQFNLGIKKLVCVWVGWGEQTRRRYEIFSKGIKTILVLKRSIGFTIHRLIFFFCVLP